MEILILGPVSLRLNGQIIEFGSDKERIAMAALALDAGRAVPLQTLIRLLWDGREPDHARESVHSYISRIRKRLRMAGDSAPQIVTKAHTYCLLGADELVDWHVFQRMTESGVSADDRRSVELLTRAEGLWRGEPLAGLPGSWAESTRRRMLESRLRATLLRTGAQLRLGLFTELIGELSALADEHPADENVLGQLLLAYYGSHRYPEALGVYQDARRVLLAEYGARPGTELNRLHQGILDGTSAFQLATSDHPQAVRATSGTAVPSSPAPRNLPHQPPLVGRSREVRTLIEAVDTATDGSVVSLHAVNGMAGAGKTAVAVHTASRLANRFPAAQIYLNLRAHSPAQPPLGPAEALATLLRLLGAAAQTLPVDLDQLTTLWRHMLAEQRAVIVLDDAVSAAQVTPLLPEGSPSLVIVTSRRHLTGVPHARTVPLDVMPTPDAIALFRQFAGEDRTSDVREVRRIVQLCGNLPLAIELVATRFQTRRSWTLANLAERLSKNPGRLAEIRDAEQDVSRAFHLSYQSLTTEQRAAFRRLSLHPGSDFTADVAATMLDVPLDTAERLLDELLSCHLLRESSPDRYHFHNLLHEYARLLADSEDGDHRPHILHRMTDFYARAADRADRLRHPWRIRPRFRATPTTAPLPHLSDAEAAKSWLSCERDNLLAVEDHAHAHGDPESAARLGYSLAGFLEAECHWREAEAILRRAVAHWELQDSRNALCRALICLSAVQANTAQYSEAALTGRQALDLARAAQDSEAEGEALQSAGVLHWHQGDARAALDAFQAALAIKSAAGDVWGTARVRNNAASPIFILGDRERAMEYVSLALEGFAETGDRMSSAKTLHNRGDIFLNEGGLDAARRSFEDSLIFMDAVGSRYDKATTRVSLADTMKELGEAASALPLYLEALREFRSMGDVKSEAETLIGIGDAHRGIGNSDEAIRHLANALKLATDIGATHHVAQAHRCLGQAHLGLRRTPSAVQHFKVAATTAARIHDIDEMVAAQVGLAEARMASGERADKLKIVNEGLASLRRTGDAELDDAEMDILGKRVTEALSGVSMPNTLHSE